MHHFGCPIYVRVENAGKLDEQAKLAKFVGYSELHGYGYPPWVVGVGPGCDLKTHGPTSDPHGFHVAEGPLQAPMLRTP